MKNIKKILMLLMLCVTLAAGATTYYVDQSHSNASDSNPGTIDLPWKTIGRAVSILTAGDTVFIRGGTYSEYIILGNGNSGNATDGYITYAGYPGEQVILDGSTKPSWTYAFISGDGWTAVDYIAIKNLEIRNYGGGGVLFDRRRDTTRKGSQYILLEDLKVHHNDGNGIFVWEGGTGSSGSTHHIVVRNCELYNNTSYGVKFNGDDAGVITRGHIHDSSIENCLSYNNSGAGIHVSTGNYNIMVSNNVAHSNGRQGITGHEIWDSVYEGNTVYGNGIGSDNSDEGIVIWSGKNVIVRKNIIYDHQGGQGYGLYFGDDLVNTGSAPIVYQNIIYNNTAGLGIEYGITNGKIWNNVMASNNGAGIYIGSGCSGHEIQNNIVYENGTQMSIQSSASMDYNLYSPSYNDGGSHSVSDNPLFVDAPSGDFHLQSASPAIDVGTDVGLADDIEGNAVPQGDQPDIGAYESEYTSIGGGGETESSLYYVDQSHGNASDSNPGSIDQPWKTIGHAVSVVTAGDTVYIRGGTYSEYIILGNGNSGNATDGYITYAGYPGEQVILDGSSQPSWTYAFISGDGWTAVDYIAIKNLEIRNYGGGGVLFDRRRDTTRKGSQYILLEDLKVHHNDGTGIYIWEGGTGSSGSTHHIVVRNSELYNNTSYGVKFNGDDAGVITRGHIHDSAIENCISYNNSAAGIHVSTGNYNIIVKNNISHDNGRQGITGHEIWDSIFEGNTVYSNGKGSDNSDEGIVIWSGKNVIVRKNIIYDHQGGQGYGLYFGDDLVNTGSAPIVYQNIIYNNTAGLGMEYGITNGKIWNNVVALNNGSGIFIGSGCSGHEIQNNIVYENGTQMSIQSSASMDNNLYSPSYNDGGSQSLSENPLFVDAPSGDFHLQSTSPAIDAGADVGLTDDIEGNSLPLGNQPDIGPYESMVLPLIAPTNLRIKT